MDTTELLRAAHCVVTRYTSGGFEDATEQDRAVLDVLTRAIEASEVTDVMFRVNPRQHDRFSVYALFPGHAGTSEPHTCSCYQHVGQHSSGDLKACIANSRPATAGEYHDLKRELEGRGYVLNVISRATAQHARERRKQVAR